MARIRANRKAKQQALIDTRGTALYLRVSTARQVEEGYGLDAQRQRLDAYCLAHDWTVSPEHIYIDAGVTGTSTEERDALNTMMAAARRGVLRRIVAAKLDRLARNVADFLRIAEELRALDVDLVLISESFDTSTPAGKFALTMFAAMAELESSTIKERMTGGRRAKAAAGGYLGAPLPLGYDRDPAGGALVNEEEAATVRRIFAEFNAGGALLHIAARLNADNVATKRGGRWYAGTVRHIVNNGTYAGLAQWGDIEEESTHYPAIIARAEYDAAISRLARLPMGPTRGK